MKEHENKRKDNYLRFSLSSFLELDTEINLIQI